MEEPLLPQHHADGDGQRNPQDIDDAALATAVYLCSGSDDLATDAGQRAAVYRYNHSQEYVALVLAFYRAYVAGEFTAVPDGAGTTLPSAGPGSGGGGGGAAVPAEPGGGGRIGATAGVAGAALSGRAPSESPGTAPVIICFRTTRYAGRIDCQKSWS